MRYLNVEEAKQRPGLKLALTAGFPGPWSEAAKGIFYVKGLDFVPVRQDAGRPKGSRKNKFTVLGVEAPGWQDAEMQE